MISCSNNAMKRHVADNFIKNDIGLAGIMDYSGRILCATTQQMTLIQRKFRHREDLIGQFMHDLFDKDLAKLYCQHGEIACRGEEWSGFEPCFIQGVNHYAMVFKSPVFDDIENKIIGCFYQARVIQQRSLHQFIIELQTTNKLFKRNPSNSLEIYQAWQGADLTEREMECLFYTLRGKTAKATARVLNISPKTVEFYIEHLKKKFNCYCKAELIEKAIELGYLEKIPKSIFYT